MDENTSEHEFNQWFSSYGVITAERILWHLKFDLPSKMLLDAVKKETSFYHYIIQTPLKSVLNGIILQQANDYHIYVQKLFIDYLLSGESGKPPESQGAVTRESIEEERKILLELGEEFSQIQMDHEVVISSSQKSLIALCKEFNTVLESLVKRIRDLLAQNNIVKPPSQVRESIIKGLTDCAVSDSLIKLNSSVFIKQMNQLLQIEQIDSMNDDLEYYLSDLFVVAESANDLISGFIEKANDLGHAARSYRKSFYNSVLKVLELMNMLPEYKINPEQDAINRENLYFDKTIGEL